MTVTLTVHRGTQAIGGSCIEIASANGERLILDAGLPLDLPPGEPGSLPATLDLDRPATLLISHAHLDHWGLLPAIPAHWPIWAGEKTAGLIALSSALFGSQPTRPISTWTSRSGAFRIGPFSVTPILTDHSAPDAYMLLIEVGGRRILYSGDFRIHGRKASLVERLMARPPGNLDVLILEGTNLGTSKPAMGEDELEAAFVALLAETRRHVFVQWSAQNIDRTVTLFRAARRGAVSLAIDLYAADVLSQLAPGTRLPAPGPDFPELKVLVTPRLRRFYQMRGRGALADGYVRAGVATSRRKLAASRAIIMCRDTMLDEFARDGLGFTPDDCYVFSSWAGYLDESDPASGWARARSAGARTVKIHTSGHASPADLARFAASMAPKAVVPVHGANWDAPGIGLPPIRRLADGEAWVLP